MTPEQQAAIARAMGQGSSLTPEQKAALERVSKPERGFWGTVKDNLVGDDDPTTMNFGEKVGALLNKGGEGMTLGLVGDEAAGAFDAAVGRGEDRTEFYRQQEAQLEEEHPYLSMAAEIGGALALPGAGAANFIGRGANLATQSLRSMAAGGVGGGIYGAMEGDDGDRMAGALQGGAGGMAFGAAAPALAQLAQKAWRGGSEAVARGRTGKAIGQAVGASPVAGRTLAELAQLEPAQSMHAAMTRAGRQNMLADAGPSMQGALDASMRSPGPAARTAVTRIDDRAASARDNITAELDRVMGAPSGVREGQRAIRESTAGKRGTTYDAAYAQPIDYSSPQGRALEGLLPRLPKSVIDDANKLMQMNEEVSSQIMAKVGDDGRVQFLRMPDTRQWDYIKRALDQAAEGTEGKGALGAQTPFGRSYESLGGSVRDNLRTANPAYGEALETAADAISRVKAIDFGSGLFNDKTTREMVRERVKKATGPELQALKQGARAQIDEIVSNVRAVASDQNVDARQALSAFNRMSSDAVQEKLALVLKDDWPALKKQLDEAGAALGLRARVSMNSQTAGRQFFDSYLDDAMEPSALRQGKVLDAAKGATATAMGASRDVVNKRKAAVRGEVADVLTRPGQGGDILQAIERAIASNQINPQAGSALAQLLQRALLGAGATNGSRALPIPQGQ